MYVVCMWRVSSILLLYLLDLESVNKIFLFLYALYIVLWEVNKDDYH